MLASTRLISSSPARAAEHLVSLQTADGCWEGEMIWCPVVTAQVAITRHVVGLPFSAAETERIVLYFGRMLPFIGNAF